MGLWSTLLRSYYADLSRSELDQIVAMSWRERNRFLRERWQGIHSPATDAKAIEVVCLSRTVKEVLDSRGSEAGPEHRELAALLTVITEESQDILARIQARTARGEDPARIDALLKSVRDICTELGLEEDASRDDDLRGNAWTAFAAWSSALPAPRPAVHGDVLRDLKKRLRGIRTEEDIETAHEALRAEAESGDLDAVLRYEWGSQILTARAYSLHLKATHDKLMEEIAPVLSQVDEVDQIVKRAVAEHQGRRDQTPD